MLSKLNWNEIMEYLSRFRGIAYKQTVVFLAYFLSGKLGLYIYHSFDTSPAIIWPPVAISLVAMVFWGYPIWFSVFLAQFMIVMTAVPDQWAFALVSGGGYALQTFVAAFVMRKLGFTQKLDQLMNALTLIFVSFSLTLIEPMIATLWQYANDTLMVNFMLSWTRSWGAGVFSILVFASFIFTWFPFKRFVPTPRGLAEIASALLLMTGMDFFLFWTNYPQFFGISVIFFLPAVFVWFALRLPIRWLTLGIFTTSLIAISGTIIAHPSVLPINVVLLTDEVYIGLVAAIALVFAAVVAERRAAYSALAENNKSLQEALEAISREDQAKSDFLAILAHELRNPLAPVISSLELMKIKMTEENREDMLKLIRVATSHNFTMAHLLDDILDVSRISRKKFSLQKEVVELSAVLQSAVETIEVFYRDKTHKLTMSLPSDRVWLSADRLRLQQIIVNLLFNAGKYTNPGGNINLSAVVHPGKDMRITVSDNGIGITDHMLHQIFEPFTQVAKNPGKRGAGLGIGLFLTKQLVELHGGTIQAQSEGTGKGSKFILTFPISMLEVPPKVIPGDRRRKGFPEPEKEETPVKKHHSVLVVDDNMDAANGLGKLLEYGGHSVTVAYDGQGCLDLMQEKEINAVLLDIGLPGMDGYEVARRIRAIYGDTPFLIALTGYGQDQDKERAREAGFNMHLTKPVSAADILGALK